MILAVFNCGQALLKLQVRKIEQKKSNKYIQWLLIACHVDSVPLLHFAKPFSIPFTSHPSAPPQTSNFLVEVSCFHHPNVLLAALVSQLRFLLTNFRRQSNVFQFSFIKRIADRVTYFIFHSMTLEHKEYSPVARIGPYHRTIGCWSRCPFSPTPCFRRISLCRLSRTVVSLFWSAYCGQLILSVWRWYFSAFCSGMCIWPV